MRREVLSNGLTVLVQEDRSSEVVAVVTRVQAGFFDEPDRWTGISHVLEHMFFKGTRRRGVGAIARETKAAGGYLNASTGYDHTSYFTVLPAAALEAALDIQSDALQNSRIEPDELARELQVIIQEAKRKRDTPSAVTYETLHEVMFDQHRIRRWRIGHEDQLARLTRDDLWGYYSSRYVPERTIVGIVGAVDPERALELARRSYAGWPGAPAAVDRSPEEPPRSDVRVRTLRGDVAHAQLALGWRTVDPLHRDAPALSVAALILGAGRGGWLYRTLVEPGVVTGASAHHHTPTELGVFGVTAELEADRMEAALAGVAGVVARLREPGPTADEMDRARILLRARWARRLESMEGRAAALAAADALADVAFLDREYAALLAVGTEAVRTVADRYLSPGAVSAVAYLPSGQGEDLEVGRVAATFARSGPAVVDPPAISLPPAPSSRALGEGGIREAGVLQVSLPGVDLLVRRKPGVPLVSLGIYAARLDLDPPVSAGLGALTIRSAVRGAAGWDAAALAFAFERLGGTLGPVATSDWLGFSATVLADHLGAAAGLLDRVYREPHLEEKEVNPERGLMISEAQQVADDMFQYPFQLAFGLAFGERGYGLPVSGLPRTLPTITASHTRSWHAGILGLRPVVVAVGDFDPARAAGTLAAVFQDSQVREPMGALPPLDWMGQSGDGSPMRVVDREKAQSAVAMVFPGPGRRAPDRAVARVWAAIASGLGGRLFEALRDRRSLAYTVLASAWEKARAGALVTYIATSPEREEEARAAMLEQLDRFAREPVSQPELHGAINYLSGQAEVARQSGRAVAAEILEAWVAGTGLHELADPAAAFRAVTAEDVQRLTVQYLDPSRRVEGVVRGGGPERAGRRWPLGPSRGRYAP